MSDCTLECLDNDIGGDGPSTFNTDCRTPIVGSVLQL